MHVPAYIIGIPIFIHANMQSIDDYHDIMKCGFHQISHKIDFIILLDKVKPVLNSGGGGGDRGGGDRGGGGVLSLTLYFHARKLH